MSTENHFHGSAAFDSPELRALRVRAEAQVQNLQNAIRNGAFGHALTLRAGVAAEATRELARAIIRRDLESAATTQDDGVIRCSVCGGFAAAGPASTYAMHRHVRREHPSLANPADTYAAADAFEVDQP